MRLAIAVGIAAAVVQVVGLLRRPLLVPSYAANAASTDPNTAASGRDWFTTAHLIPGNIIEESRGCIHYRVDAAGPGCTATHIGRSVVYRPRRRLGGRLRWPSESAELSHAISQRGQVEVVGLAAGAAVSSAMP
jgi:hypothetical protein